MSIVTGQVTAPTSPANIVVCVVPNGTDVILSTTSASADVFIGTSATLTSANGMPVVPNSYLTFEYPSTASTVTIYATAGTGTAVVGFTLIGPH